MPSHCIRTRCAWDRRHPCPAARGCPSRSTREACKRKNFNPHPLFGFKELSEALKRGAVEVERHEELVQGIARKASSLLEKLAAGSPLAAGELEELVRAHVVSRNLFSY